MFTVNINAISGCHAGSMIDVLDTDTVTDMISKFIYIGLCQHTAHYTCGAQNQWSTIGAHTYVFSSLTNQSSVNHAMFMLSI